MYIQDPKLLGIFISDVRASGFRALGRLEPSKIAFGRVRIVQNLLRTGGRAGIYVHTGP